MKRWAWLTVAVYAVALLVFSLPVAWVILGLEHAAPTATTPGGLRFRQPGAEVLQLYQEWFWWVFLGVMVAGQAVLLLVPVDRATGRPTPRRRLGVTLVGGSFLLGLLLASGMVALTLAILGDATFEYLEPDRNPLLRRALLHLGLPAGQPEVAVPLIILLGIALVCGAWASWATLFWFHWQADTPEGRMARLVRVLLRGSVLELLVAIPSHVIVRHRNECCAPAGTAFGIMTGLAIMLMCFGPGVFFLFAARARRLRPRVDPAPSESR